MRTPASQSDVPFWKQYWEGMYAAPRAWAHKAENLIHAFRAVAAQSNETSLHLNLRDQAFMLAGMAIEVLLKSIIVADPARRQAVTRKGITALDKDLHKVFLSHNLVKLFAAADVALSSEQALVADILSEYVYWRGRYVLPTEKGISDLFSVAKSDGSIGQPHLTIVIADVESLVAYVVEQVRAHLYGGGP